MQEPPSSSTSSSSLPPSDSQGDNANNKQERGHGVGGVGGVSVNGDVEDNNYDDYRRQKPQQRIDDMARLHDMDHAIVEQQRRRHPPVDVPVVISTTTTPPRRPPPAALHHHKQQQDDDDDDHADVHDDNIISLGVNQTLSELSDGPSPSSSHQARQQQEYNAGNRDVDVGSMIPITGSPTGKSAIQNFFFPPRQHNQSLPSPKLQVDEDDTFEDEPATGARTRTSQITNGRRRTATAISTTNTSSSSPPSSSSGIPQQRSPPAIQTSDGPQRLSQDQPQRRQQQQQQCSPSSLSVMSPSSPNNGLDIANNSVTAAHRLQEQEDNEFVEKFWTIYDELLIISLFTQIGILCRLGAASFFRAFDGVFTQDSALFVNLPLNCLSCFVMGLLCSGESLMEIISTRFTPPRLQHDLHREAQLDLRGQEHEDLELVTSRSWSVSWDKDVISSDDDDDDEMEEMETVTGAEMATGRRLRRRNRLNSSNGRRRRRPKRQKWKQSRSRFRRQQQAGGDVFVELREVQLLAWERRIRSSICLLLFPVKQEDVDVVENYFSGGYVNRRESLDQSHRHLRTQAGLRVHSDSFDDRNGHDDKGGDVDEMHPNDVEEDAGFDDLILQEEDEYAQSDIAVSRRQSTSGYLPSTADSMMKDSTVQIASTPGHKRTTSSSSQFPSTTRLDTKGSNNSVQDSTPSIRTSTRSDLTPIHDGRQHASGVPHARWREFRKVEGGQVVDYGTQDSPDLDQVIEQVAIGVQKNISRFQRVNLANGWDVGTSPQEKSEDLMLGLRDGLCGALSSFTSWISAMVNLFQNGQIGQGFVGLVLGIQLPLVAYRFGQFVAVYVFVWRCRRENNQSEKRGYGLQLHSDDRSSMDDFADRSHHSVDSGDDMSASQWTGRTKGRRTVHDEESNVPSVRAIVTALCIMFLVAQLTALHFFYEPKQRLLALSLLFSPLGVLARWRMMKLNSWCPSFPIGTFACNITSCALSGSLGTVLAGNPGPRQRIALVAVIDGFGGTLSSVARFIIEIIAGMDPVLFRLDGAIYAVASVCTGLLVSFLFSASLDWADQTQPLTDDMGSVMPSLAPSMSPTLMPSMSPTEA